MDNMEIAGELAKAALEKGYMVYDSEPDTTVADTVRLLAENTATFIEVVYKKLEELYGEAVS